VVAILVAVLVATAPVAGDDLVPADGLGLEEGVVATSEPDPPTQPLIPLWPVPAGLAGTATVVSVAGARIRRRDPVYVLVHGDGGSAEDFDLLMYRMGVARDSTVAFDYRTVHDGRTSTHASRRAATSDAAVALDALIRDLAAEHGSVYSVHHSRGGAVGVEMIAAIDDGRRPPIPGYRGAALLDPAIGSHGVGGLQRLGRHLGFLPDNGGFDPIRCVADRCRDIRVRLGRRAGVEVVAIRNPDALVTNFVDRPMGLRTYDLVDDGRPSALAWWWNPLALVQRVFEAHGSVLEHQSIADCVRAESLEPGSCRWSAHRSRAPMWGRGAGRNLVR
jgi:hypothetical protein